MCQCFMVNQIIRVTVISGIFGVIVGTLCVMTMNYVRIYLSQHLFYIEVKHVTYICDAQVLYRQSCTDFAPQCVYCHVQD